MELIPAIDLRGGRCVQLVQGDYEREAVSLEDPVGMAEHWVELGARRLHIVDLDGARDGERKNAMVVRDIASRRLAPLQVGGGIRSADDAERLLDAGVERVIFGTAAVEAPAEVAETVERRGSASVVVGVDARGEVVATRGWRTESSWSVPALIESMGGLGVRRFLYTDIARDGTLSGPNVAAIKDILDAHAISLIAAGGIAGFSDLEALAEVGVEAAVAGTAIYTGAIDFEDAVQRL